MSKLKKSLVGINAEVIERVKSLPAKDIAHSISDFEITTDSVVAKATVVTDKSTRRIFIDWGDGQNDTINLVPGRKFGVVNRLSTSPAETLPEGTFEIYHAYDEPEDRKTFSHTVLLHVEDTTGGDDLRLREISLTPRYRIVHYQARFQLRETCDVDDEIQNFKVVMYLDGVPVRECNMKIPNSPAGSVIWHLVEDSQFSREVSIDTPFDERPRVGFKFTESDFLFNDHGQYSAVLNYNMVTGPVESLFSVSDQISESCRIAIRYDREVSLIANMPSVSGPASFAAR